MRALLGVTLLGTLLVATPVAVAAPPAGACQGEPEPARPAVGELPWAQRALDLNRTWPHSTGAGVTVAVVDSGVDADHPQLRHTVLPGADFHLVGNLAGNFDCVSHGTAVASIIVAAPAEGVGFRGVAPGARVLPVRITDRELNDGGEATPISPDVVAAGIRYATDQGAGVINLSLSGYGDFPAIRDAIAHAQARDALVVAAVGNRDGQAPGLSYPAGYDGVLGVGSIDIQGVRAEGSLAGPQVDLVAPGQDVLAAARGAGHDYRAGTSFAAPFVSGVAALVRARYPSLDARQVARRLMATAAPAPGGQDSPEYGAGIVDPYRAVTEDLSGREPLALPPVEPIPPDPAEIREASWWRATGVGARVGAGLVFAAIVVVVVVALAVPAARRRRWAVTRRPELPMAPGRQETPDQIFLFPAGKS